MIPHSHSTTRRRLFSLLILCGITGISCLLIFSSFLFGDQLAVFNDAGSDTRQQYLMQYATIVNHLRSGNFSLWDLSNGFGASLFSLNMSNIFLMLVYLVGVIRGVGYLSGAIVYLLILQILLAAVICYFLLDCFGFSERSKILVSYIYALNGYMVLWGQHYQFGSFVVFLPLLLLLLERAIRRKKMSLSVPLLVAAMVCSSVYMSYMSLILAGCYLLYRMILSDDSFGARLRQFWLHCCSMVLGLGLGSFIFLPMVRYLLTISSRLDSNQSFLQKLLGYCSLFPADFYKTAFLRFFATSIQGLQDYSGYSNLYEAPVLFFSLLFVLLLFQYLFTIHRQPCAKKAKVLQYLAVLFFVFCMLIRLGASIFNAFAYPFSRHSFLFMPLFALLAAYTLDQLWERAQYSLVGFVLSLTALAAAHWIAWHEATETLLRDNLAWMFLLSLAMAAILAAGCYLRRRRLRVEGAMRILGILLLLCVIVNMTRESWLCYNDRNLLTKSDAEYWGGLYDPDVADALAYLAETDTSLYRVEKDYHSGSYCMDGLAQGYRGISTYNSTQNRNIEEFVNLVIPNFPLMATYEYSYRQIGWYTGHSTLFGIRYLLAREDDLQLDGFTLRKQFGGIYLYENTEVTSFARFYTSVGDSALLEDAYGTLDLEDLLLDHALLDLESDDTLAALAEEVTGSAPLSQEELSASYALEELQQLDDITADGTEETVSIPLDATVLEGCSRVYLEFDIRTDTVSDITVNEEDPLEYRFRTKGSGKKSHVQVRVPSGTTEMTLSCYSKTLQGTVSNIRLLGAPSTDTNAADTAAITMENTGTDSHLTGTIQTDQGGFLFLPIPYEDGWSAQVDGEDVTILRTDVGFVSIPVSAGTHTFTFTYRQPWMRTGVCVSIGSALLWAALLVHRLRRRSRTC